MNKAMRMARRCITKLCGGVSGKFANPNTLAKGGGRKTVFPIRALCASQKCLRDYLRSCGFLFVAAGGVEVRFGRAGSEAVVLVGAEVLLVAVDQLGMVVKDQEVLRILVVGLACEVE